MYFFKFMKWFWFEWMDDVPQRVFALIILYSTLGLICGGISMITGSTVIMGYFGVFAFVSIILALVISIGIFMHNRFIEWQDRVFNKIRGDE